MRRIPVSALTAAAGRLLVALLFGGALLTGTDSFGQSSRANPRCVQAGGTLMTNFISQTTTLGTATGDLKGAVAATILSVTPGPGSATTFRVQHQWVTEAGETLAFEPADAVGVPAQAPGVFGVTYEEVELVGGTGKYDGARGQLRVFGAADLQRGETVFRYEGEVCFRSAGGS
jgi:hypothetical protein